MLGVVAGEMVPEQVTGNLVAGTADFLAPPPVPPLLPDDRQPLNAFMLTWVGAWRNSPTVALSPPPPLACGATKEVTVGSPPTSRPSWSGSFPAAQGLDLNLIVWVTVVPAGISCAHGPVTTLVWFGGND